MNVKEIKYQKRLTALEAALYAAGHPLGIQDLMNVIGSKSERIVLKLLKELAKKIELRGGALEIKFLAENRVVMSLKPSYNSLVKKFTNKPLLKTGSLKTLGYIAYHQPIEQGQIIEDRGRHIYTHLKQMEELGLIIREKIDDKHCVIKTTAFFCDYFGIGENSDNSKIMLKQIFDQIKVPQIQPLEPIISIPLTNSRDGLTDRLPQYSRPPN
ncbi:SMC-Scp complex subunit ScpB [Candidatus Bathyarchaeota archaeon]|nr:SMC-Scp complex subunit ScpB [Candidatus Bathyarchaeota archaeon]